MKKIGLFTAIILVVLIGGTYGAYKVMDHIFGSQPPKTVKNTGKAAVVAAAEAAEEAEGAIDQQQTAKIGGVQYDIGIDASSSEDAVINVMHKMTHQKVKAEEKWGAIPMTPETINQVYDIVKNSQFKRKQDLLAILEKWKTGNFTQIDTDHNYFWQYQGGTIGKAYGIMTQTEEQTFILNNFNK